MEPFPALPDAGAVDEYRDAILAGYRGDAAAVRSASASNEPLARQAAIGAAVRLGLDDAAKIVAMAFADSDPGVRSRAAEASIHLDTIEPSVLLVDTEPSVVEVACFACGEIGQVDPERFEHGPPIGTLCKLALDHDEALVRESAVAALGAIGDPTTLDTVIKACSDRVTVRRRAVLALAAFDDPAADETLRTALNDKDWQVRQAAEDLLEVGRRLEGEADPDAYAE